MSGAGPGEPGLRCDVRRTSPIGLIEVIGVLRLATKAALWEAVLKVLPDAPKAIVLDLTGLEAVEDGASLAVFPTLCQLVAAQTECELILAVPSLRLRVALRRAPALFVRVFATRAEAWLAAEEDSVRQRMGVQLPANPYAPRLARRLVDGMCALWELDSELQERARIVVTELVTNAVEHATGDIGVIITVRQCVLRLEVSDHTTVLPDPPEPSPDTTEGHNLQLVTKLASYWGSKSTTHGKIIWADLVLKPSAPRGK